MGVFSDIGSAKTFEQGGSYFFPGDWYVSIDSSLIEPSAKNKKIKHAKVKCKTIECEVPLGSKNKAYPAGKEVNFVCEVTKDMGASNAKAFAMAAGEEALWQAGASHEAVTAFLRDFKQCEVEEGQEHPCEKHLADIFKPNGLVKGLKIRVEAFNKPTSEGKDFTRLRWLVSSRPDDFDIRAV